MKFAHGDILVVVQPRDNLKMGQLCTMIEYVDKGIDGTFVRVSRPDQTTNIYYESRFVLDTPTCIEGTRAYLAAVAGE